MAYGGVTNNTIVGDYGHWHLLGNFGSYWRTPLRLLANEAFAHHFSQGFTGSTTEGAIDATLLPNSWQILDDMMDEVGEASRQKLGWTV